MIDAIDTIDYRGYKIEVHVDMHPMNPWTDLDCEPPILVAANDSPRRTNIIEYGVEDNMPHLTDSAIRPHWSDMLKTMGYKGTWRDLLTFAREEQLEPSCGESLIDVLRDEHAEHVSNESAADRLDAYCDAYTWLGVVAYNGSVTGCSQGDQADVLCVCTPEWAERVGAPAETHEDQARGGVKLFGDYAFGNVYGFVVTDPDGEEVSSCWGFYGDPEKSGLLEDARSGIDADIPHRAQRVSDD